MSTETRVGILITHFLSAPPLGQILVVLSPERLALGSDPTCDALCPVQLISLCSLSAAVT